MNLVRLEITVDRNRVAHTRVICGTETFSDVLDGLEICRSEIEYQINNRMKCPMSPNLSQNEKL